MMRTGKLNRIRPPRQCESGDSRRKRQKLRSRALRLCGCGPTIQSMAGKKNNLEKDLEARLAACRETIRTLGSAVVGFSGGVDSSLLLSLAVETLGADNVLAVIGVSPIHPEHERLAARRIAEKLGVELLEVETDEMNDSTFTSNPPDRCYHCKLAIFGLMKRIADERGLAAVVSGANADDTGDYRPGLRAEEQLGIRRPLLEAGLGKEDIRAVSRKLGLETADKPSSACLASRVPYGEEITPGKLARIEKAEAVLRDMGFRQCRLRDHGQIARIEVPPEQTARAVELRNDIVAAVKLLGYSYVTLDLEGFRSGSLNETL